MADLNAILGREAKAYIKKHAIAFPGDIVTTTWGGWKKPRRVRVYRVGAHLVCRYDDELRDWCIGFAMTYCAERLRKDGTSAERAPGMGIYLSNLTTEGGKQWHIAASGTSRQRHEESGFNHAGLSWPRVTERRTDHA